MSNETYAIIGLAMMTTAIAILAYFAATAFKPLKDAEAANQND